MQLNFLYIAVDRRSSDYDSSLIEGDIVIHEGRIHKITEITSGKDNTYYSLNSIGISKLVKLGAINQ